VEKLAMCRLRGAPLSVQNWYRIKECNHCIVVESAVEFERFSLIKTQENNPIPAAPAMQNQNNSAIVNPF
jgi:hypothetical protein